MREIDLSWLAEQVAAGFDTAMDFSRFPDKLSPTGIPYETYINGLPKEEGSQDDLAVFDTVQDAVVAAMREWNAAFPDRGEKRLFWRKLPHALALNAEDGSWSGWCVRWRLSVEPAAPPKPVALTLGERMFLRGVLRPIGVSIDLAEEEIREAIYRKLVA